MRPFLFFSLTQTHRNTDVSMYLVAHCSSTEALASENELAKTLSSANEKLKVILMAENLLAAINYKRT